MDIGDRGVQFSGFRVWWSSHLSYLSYGCERLASHRLERKNAKCDGCTCKCKWQIEEDIIRTYQLEYLFLSILSFTSFSVFIRIYNLLSGFHSDGNRLLASAINAQLLPLTLPTAFMILPPSSPRHTHPQGRNRRKQRKDDRLQRLDALLLRDGAHDEGEHRAA